MNALDLALHALVLAVMVIGWFVGHEGLPVWPMVGGYLGTSAVRLIVQRVRHLRRRRELKKQWQIDFDLAQLRRRRGPR